MAFGPGGEGSQLAPGVAVERPIPFWDSDPRGLARVTWAAEGQKTFGYYMLDEGGHGARGASLTRNTGGGRCQYRAVEPKVMPGSGAFEVGFERVTEAFSSPSSLTMRFHRGSPVRVSWLNKTWKDSLAVEVEGTLEYRR